MKKTWELKKLKDVCSFQNGFAFKSKDFKDSGTPVLRISNIQKDKISYKKMVYVDVNDYKQDLSQFKVAKGDLVIAMSGATTGKLAVSDSDQFLYLNQRVGKFVPGKSIDYRWLYHYLSTKVEENLKISAGAAQPNLSTEQIKNFQIPAPAVSEQRRIVSVLDKKLLIISDLEKVAQQQIIESENLFVSQLNEVFCDLVSESGFKKFGDVASFVRGPFGGSLKKAFFKPEGYAVYEQQHAIYDQFTDVRYFVDKEKFNEMKRFEVFPGDLIMSCSGTIGKTAIVPVGVKQGIINQALLKLTPYKDALDVRYMQWWMKSSLFDEEIKANSGGAAISNVASVKVLKEIMVPVPSLSKQRAVVKELDEYLQKKNNLIEIFEKKLVDLIELKKSYLQEAFTGNL